MSLRLRRLACALDDGVDSATIVVATRIALCDDDGVDKVGVAVVDGEGAVGAIGERVIAVVAEVVAAVVVTVVVVVVVVDVGGVAATLLSAAAAAACQCATSCRWRLASAWEKKDFFIKKKLNFKTQSVCEYCGFRLRTKRI